MIISKNGKDYEVKEYCKKWRVERTIGGVAVAYEVPKELCSTVEELEKYIAGSDELF